MEHSKDGSLDPQWLQEKSKSDELFSRIRAYFLPGSKIKPDVQCHARVCVMPTKTAVAINEKTAKEEYNPMMLCYFCDRTFHTGCYNLDASLIKEEKVPWRCGDCICNVKNTVADKFYKVSKGYKISMKDRRAKYLRDTVIPEANDYATDDEYDQADKQSFKRRALQVASFDDSSLNLSSLDEASEIEILQHSVMRAKTDEIRARETNKRVLASLQAEQLKSREAASEIEFLRKQVEALSRPKRTTDQFVDPEEDPAASSTRNHSANEVLTNQYTSKKTTAPIEENNYRYAPPPPPPRANASSNAYGHNNRNSNGQSNNNSNREGNIGDNPSDNRNANNDRGTSSTYSSARNDDDNVAHLLARLTFSQERDEERKLLAMRRKAVPKIIDFHGDSNKWLAFKQDVERYRVNCQFDDETIKLYLRGALKGEAFQLVKDLFDRETLDHIMEVLKLAYGDEMMLIRKRSEELRKIKIDSHLYRSEVVKLQAAIQSYFAACNYSGLGYLNSNELGESVFAQFGPEDRQRCKEYCRTPNTGTIVISIQKVYDYLLSRLPLLDDIPIKSKVEKSDKRTFQLNFVASPSQQSNDKEAYKFELRDKQTAIYIGYDMTKVNAIAKKCEVCGRAGHFSFQCNLYKAMSEADRMKAIKEKNLCRSCLITTAHKAANCDIKTGCGIKVTKSSRCCLKHHITIHNAVLSQLRNSSSKRIRQDSEESSLSTDTGSNEDPEDNSADLGNTEESVVEVANLGFHAVDPVEEIRQYEVVPLVGNIHNLNDKKGTVKIFKVNFIGPNGMVTEYAIGDSGSEVTLVREDLRQALGINGVNKPLCLQWSDKTKRTTNAVKLDLIIQGVNDGCQRHTLKDCFSVSCLNLPPRSLNMEMLSKLYPHLREAEFESYSNIKPVMLIGSPHAHLIEGNGKLLESGDKAPVGLSTKLGWTVYGGSSSLKSPKSNQIECTVFNLSNKSVELEETQQNIKQINLNPLKKPESHEICTFKSDSSSKPFQTYDAKQNEASMHFNPNSDRSALIFHTGQCQLSGTGSYWWQIMRIKHALDPGIGHYGISFPNAQPMIRMNLMDDFVSSGEILSLEESDKNFVIEI